MQRPFIEARGYTEMAERLAELVPAGRMEEAVDAFRAVAEAAGRAARS